MKYVKKMILALTAAAVLSGCADIGKDAEPEPQVLASAATVYDLLPYMNESEKVPLYSEADKKSDLPRYFDFMDYYKDEYYIAEYNGEKYVLFYDTLRSSRDTLLSVDKVEKTYGGKDGSELTILATVTFFHDEVYRERIVAPVSYVRCIVKLDRDITRLVVDGTVYGKFEGGRMTVGGKMCSVKEDLTLRTPPRFDMIELVYQTVNGASLEKENHRYYLCYEDGKCGVMNDKYEVLLEPTYSRIDYLGQNRFLGKDYVSMGASEDRETEFTLN